MRKEPLYARINREPALDELARAVNYGGCSAGSLREEMAELSQRYGSDAVALAFSELTMTDPTTQLTILKPHVRKLCSQIMGPPPEDPYYQRYWEGRTPPASHRPPRDEATPSEPGPKELNAAPPATKGATAEVAPPLQQSAARATVSQPRGQWRYDPSDEALDAFERLEGWLRGTNESPVDAEAEDTLRVLAQALLAGKKGWFHAAEARLLAMQQDPPSYVTANDAKAFGQTLDHLLDHLHEIALDDRKRTL